MSAPPNTRAVLGTPRQSPLSMIARGMVAGAAGTAVHTSLMWLGRQVDRFAQPPELIVDSIATPDFDKSALDHEQKRVLAWVSHVGFGVGNGALLAFLYRTIGLRRPIALGVAYGLGLYTASYMGVIPALGILPLPQHDNRARQLALVAAHVGYGVAAGQVLSRSACGRVAVERTRVSEDEIDASTVHSR